jgi:hypothetical protein
VAHSAENSKVIETKKKVDLAIGHVKNTGKVKVLNHARLENHLENKLTV